MIRRLIATEEAMSAFGACLATALAPGAVITLSGPLGAGKTVLARAMLQALGHPGRVRSPTYTLVESYHLSALTLHHFDLYRLGDPGELQYLGLRDFLEAGSVCVFEWPERAADALPPVDLAIAIAPHDDGSRELTVESLSVTGEAMLANLGTDKRQ